MGLKRGCQSSLQIPASIQLTKNFGNQSKTFFVIELQHNAS